MREDESAFDGRAGVLEEFLLVVESFLRALLEGTSRSIVASSDRQHRTVDSPSPPPHGPDVAGEL